LLQLTNNHLGIIHQQMVVQRHLPILTLRTGPRMTEGEDNYDFLQAAEVQEGWEGQWSIPTGGVQLSHQGYVCECHVLDVSDIGFDGSVAEPSGTLPMRGHYAITRTIHCPGLEVQNILFEVEETTIDAFRVLECVTFIA
jgi:hypothetical protein